jgi:hypothetical protein
MVVVVVVVVVLSIPINHKKSDRRAGLPFERSRFHIIFQKIPELVVKDDDSILRSTCYTINQVPRSSGSSIVVQFLTFAANEKLSFLSSFF